MGPGLPDEDFLIFFCQRATWLLLSELWQARQFLGGKGSSKSGPVVIRHLAPESSTQVLT